MVKSDLFLPENGGSRDHLPHYLEAKQDTNSGAGDPKSDSRRTSSTESPKVINYEGVKDPVSFAVFCGDKGGLRTLLKDQKQSRGGTEAQGQSGSAASDGEWGPLHMAALSGRAAAAAELLQAGYDVNTRKGAIGSTALHLAASRTRSIDVAKVLIADPGLDLQLGRGADGATALHVACFSGSAELVEALIAAGADPSRVDNNGASPLDLAVAGNQVSNVECLAEMGVVVTPGNLKQLHSTAAAANDILLTEALKRVPVVEPQAQGEEPSPLSTTTANSYSISRGGGGKGKGGENPDPNQEKGKEHGGPGTWGDPTLPPNLHYVVPDTVESEDGETSHTEGSLSSLSSHAGRTPPDPSASGFEPEMTKSHNSHRGAAESAFVQQMPDPKVKDRPSSADLFHSTTNPSRDDEGEDSKELGPSPVFCTQ